jgi:hypothetical protein
MQHYFALHMFLLKTANFVTKVDQLSCFSAISRYLNRANHPLIVSPEGRSAEMWLNPVSCTDLQAVARGQ